MKRFSRAAVFGKFWPLHLGHLKLIENAKKLSESVVVFVDDGNEDVPVNIRISWITNEISEVTAVSAPDLCGHESEKCTEKCSKNYAEFLKADYGDFDAIFAGDSYGYTLAHTLNITPVIMDRTADGFMGRLIRQNISGHWNDISRSAKAYYCKRVVVVGAESTGTTTLSADLAERLGTVWVPEYGRQFTEEKGIDHQWTSKDFIYIANRQISLEDSAVYEAGPILICDTDALATYIWHERYMGSKLEEIADMARNRKPSLYILTSDDIPFVQDGYRDGEHIRAWMTNRFRDELSQNNLPWVEVSGTRLQRIESSMAAISEHLGTNWVCQNSVN